MFAPCERRAAICKVQGGTGKHIDGSVIDPLQQRPFQALVHLSDPAPAPATAAMPTMASTDGSLHVLPGFHGAALRYFQLAGDRVPEGGFTPLGDDAVLADDGLWVPARRLPSKWIALHAKGRLPPPCGAAQARSIDGVAKKLRELARELQDGAFGKSEPAHVGDYTIWDPRLPHTTGDADAFNRADVPRQVFYCAFMLARGNEAHAADQRECRESGRHVRCGHPGNSLAQGCGGPALVSPRATTAFTDWLTHLLAYSPLSPPPPSEALLCCLAAGPPALSPVCYSHCEPCRSLVMRLARPHLPTYLLTQMGTYGPARRRGPQGLHARAAQ